MSKSKFVKNIRVTIMVLTLSMGLLISCSDFKDKDSKTSSIDHVSSKSLPDYINVQVQPSTKPERYMVFFGWPQIEDQKRIRIRQDKSQVIVQPAQTTFSHEVDHNQTLTYTFDILDSTSKVEKTFSKLVIIPRDYVVRAGQSEFTENLKLNISRLFLSPDIPLRTNGFNIEIITDLIIADKGIIETFTEESKAAAGVDGLSGGELVIRSKSANGNLKIYMRGQHGGDGIPGEPYSSRAADGAPPGDGEVECGCIRGGCAPTIVLSTPEIKPLGCYCTGTGRNGGNGAAGVKGRTGGNGGAGGSYGHLKVEIQDGSSFLLETFSRAGTGGAQGAGGPGQPGGIALGSKTRCSGSLGSNGPAGPTGDPGLKGEDGKPGLICVYIASEGKNECY